MLAEDLDKIIKNNTENLDKLSKLIKSIEDKSTVESNLSDFTMAKLLINNLESNNATLDELQMELEWNKYNLEGLTEDTCSNKLSRIIQLLETNKHNDKVDRVLDIVEQNTKGVESEKILKDKRKKYIDNDIVVKLYKEGLTNVEIGKQVGLTGAGVGIRLKKLGVYEGKYKNYGSKTK